MLIASRDVKLFLDSIKNSILVKWDSSISSFKYDKNYVGGFCRSYDLPFNIVVGTELLEKGKSHDFYQFSDFVNVVELAYHESGHIFQKLDFHKFPDQVDGDVLQMARDCIISDAFREYYRTYTGYYYNLSEIDAEQYGIESAKNFLETYMPGVDAKQELLNFVNERSNLYFVGKSKTYDDMIYAFEQARIDSYDRFVHMPFCRFDSIPNPSPAYREFTKNPVNIIRYKNCKRPTDDPNVFVGGREANALLYDFVKEHQPWRFYHYECLKNEWPEAALSGEAKPPVFAKQRNLDRLEDLDAKFGNIVDAYDMLHNDESDYQMED